MGAITQVRGGERSRAARGCALALLLWFVPVCEALAEYILISKSRVFLQTSATQRALFPVTQPCGLTCPFIFSAAMTEPTRGSIPAPVLSGPIATASLGAAWNSGRFTFDPAVPEWRAGPFMSPTQADLDAKFANGSYTVAFSGRSVTLPLTGDQYPPAPLLTLTGGEWRNGFYVIDPRQSFTISSGVYAEYGSHAADGIQLVMTSAGVNLGGGHTTPPESANFRTLTVPANTLADGQSANAYVFYTANTHVSHEADGYYATAVYSSITHLTIKAELPPPVFPMTVTSNINTATATASAQIQYRPQDVGTQGSVFVFALAPASRVQGADTAGVLKVGRAKDEKKADTPIACVLAQLNASGQMVAVTSANLAAYLTGVLSAQGASVSILNGVPTSNVSGATFFVGYGSSGTAMINTGVNRAAVTVPGSLTCIPSAPQTGWWWNPLEDGRGFSIEKRGNNLFFAAFLYDISGRSNWYVSSGPSSLEGSLYNGELLSASGGQTLGGAYSRFPTLANAGPMTMTFNNESTGTIVWPGGTVPIQRFNIIQNGLTAVPVAGVPESGWWWNEQEAGRGFFMEWQGNTLDIAGYMYDDLGNPVWYLTVGEIGGTPAARTFNGTWWSYTGGQTLTGAWRQNTRSNSNVAPMTITFSGPDTALMTLPNGRTTDLKRHRF
jgi:hypothetical protein